MFEPVTPENFTKKTQIDRLLFQKLYDAQEVLGPANSQRSGNNVLRPKNSRPYRALPFAYLQFYVPGVSQRLGIERAGNREELDRPALDDDAAASMFRVPLVAEA